jgi:MoxR-like ATPase
MNKRVDTPLAAQLTTLIDQIATIIVGKRAQIEDCVACMLAGGHLLIEDVPGVGKTTLAHALAVSLGLRFARSQFTADLMPSDLIGVSVYERSQEAFVFHPGPVFAQVLLADEINRAGPKTQSALLEAMEEHQVSVEGETRALPEPFFVIATQNPSDQLGTYPLPESQLDRFLMCITLGYPDRASERALLAGSDRREAIQQLRAVMTPAELIAAQQAVQAVHARRDRGAASGARACPARSARLCRPRRCPVRAGADHRAPPGPGGRRRPGPGRAGPGNARGGRAALSAGGVLPGGAKTPQQVSQRRPAAAVAMQHH